MIYPNQVFHNPMYTMQQQPQQQYVLENQQKRHDSGQEISHQDTEAGTSSFLVAMPGTLPQETPQLEAYQLTQESMSHVNSINPETFDDTQHIHNVMHDITDNELIEQTISPHFFNAFAPSDTPKRSREVEDHPQNPRVFFDDHDHDEDAKKRARIRVEQNSAD